MSFLDKLNDSVGESFVGKFFQIKVWLLVPLKECLFSRRTMMYLLLPRTLNHLSTGARKHIFHRACGRDGNIPYHGLHPRCQPSHSRWLWWTLYPQRGRWWWVQRVPLYFNDFTTWHDGYLCLILSPNVYTEFSRAFRHIWRNIWNLPWRNQTTVCDGHSAVEHGWYVSFLPVNRACSCCMLLTCWLFQDVSWWVSLQIFPSRWLLVCFP